MSKQLNSGRYVLKINSSRLRNSDWDMKISLNEARENEELITLGDSQLLRFIRRLTDIDYSEEEISEVKQKIKQLKKEKNSKKVKNEIIELYNLLDKMLYIEDYIGVVFDNKADFDRATGKYGFKINGKKFKRLLATTGGVKANTVMFCSEDIHKELNKLLDNGRDLNKEIIPAKFEAYKALAASVSNPVTMPRILVIQDGTVHIKDKVIKVSGDDEFIVEHGVEYEADKDFTDGAGMISYEMAKKWAEDLYLDYVPSGFNTRFSFEKGMVGVFPFIEFAEEIAKSYIVKDAWGIERDIRDFDVILTTNMAKLWASYESLEDYVNKSIENGWDFCVSKTTPKVLENKRNMNYQYLQSYEDMSDEDLKELISETVNDINGALGDDPIKQILFLKGIHLNDKNIMLDDYDYLKALLIDKNVSKDPFIKTKVLNMIEKRIRDAKKGVVSVDGNYSIVFGDLYALCESMFGMEIAGLLKANEFYAKSWLDKGVNEIVAYRSPMTSHNNITKMKLVQNEKLNKWFRYMTTVTIINAWDTTTDRMNGMDYDSDAIITTNNPVILRNTREELAIICEQRSVPKVKVTEKLLKKSNKDGFGNDVGTITNRVTTMFDVLASFEKGSEEYNILMDRIICGQAYQQESIDKIKGIKAKEMPKEWYNYKDIKKLDITDDERNKLIKLMVNKKPYFFIYNYPHLYTKYNKFIKDVNNNCIIRFGMKLEDLKSKADKTEDEIIFLNSVECRNPVFTNRSLMNRLCWMVEEEFKDVKFKVKDLNGFDYSIYKTNKKYSPKTFNEIKTLFSEYKKQQRQYSQTNSTYISKEDKEEKRMVFLESFKVKASEICPNEEDLCNIVLDIAYKGNSKQFAWDICGDQIIHNLLRKNDNKYTYPMLDDNGDIEWKGYRFTMREVRVCEE